MNRIIIYSRNNRIKKNTHKGVRRVWLVCIPCLIGRGIVRYCGSDGKGTNTEYSNLTLLDLSIITINIF